ncbi:GntR family transcriptional regulator [Microbacterium marinilacus]|uniref:GntR family transcriptional regulator n=1 Tax=Microbacterium marinilacus TaxID=415209 RepID=A0ABP7BFP2_9MICO|nr:GntR family transcriptional regulator [Microbacterium marinilacus]MBY0689532.1 GntR family transcriptional regulator [Microbacterium marinilacus]
MSEPGRPARAGGAATRGSGGARRKRGRSLSEAAFQQLVRAIQHGELLPGERLLETELAERLHMSRTPVREALQRLEGAGMIEVLPNRITTVTDITPESRRTSAWYAGYQAGAAAHMAIPRLTSQERYEAAGLVDEMDSAVGTPDASASRRRLYSYLSARSGNRHHQNHMSGMEAILERNLQAMVYPAHLLDRAHEHHAALKAAILAGDADAAEQLIREQHGIPT